MHFVVPLRSAPIPTATPAFATSAGDTVTRRQVRGGLPGVSSRVNADPQWRRSQMPELPVKEGRLSELHLPEIKREDIVRSLSEMTAGRRPDEDRATSMPESTSRTASPSSMARRRQGGRRGGRGGRHRASRSRPRWPLAVGGAHRRRARRVGDPHATQASVAPGVASGATALRERIAAMRSTGRRQWLEMDRDEPVAFDAAETEADRARPVRRYPDGRSTTGYPKGLGIEQRRRHPRVRGERRPGSDTCGHTAQQASDPRASRGSLGLLRWSATPPDRTGHGRLDWIAAMPRRTQLPAIATGESERDATRRHPVVHWWPSSSGSWPSGSSSRSSATSSGAMT